MAGIEDLLLDSGVDRQLLDDRLDRLGLRLGRPSPAFSNVLNSFSTVLWSFFSNVMASIGISFRVLLAVAPARPGLRRTYPERALANARSGNSEPEGLLRVPSADGDRGGGQRHRRVEAEDAESDPRRQQVGAAVCGGSEQGFARVARQVRARWRCSTTRAERRPARAATRIRPEDRGDGSRAVADQGADAEGQQAEHGQVQRRAQPPARKHPGIADVGLDVLGRRGWPGRGRRRRSTTPARRPG